MWTSKATQLHQEGSGHLSEELLSLAWGPLSSVQQFMRYVISGFKFDTKQLERKRINQNSVVLVNKMVGPKSVDYFGVFHVEDGSNPN